MIDTDLVSERLRKKAIIPSEQKILISRLSGSEQEKDLSVPVNCDGYGRIRHFRLYPAENWSPDPLPIEPAAKALNYSAGNILKVQVFQNAACNWRCWYCFVDFKLLAANLRVSRYFTMDELLDLYLAEDDHPRVIDLSGGQPDIVPEWVLWMMKALEKRGLSNEVFLWSDDNLSTKYYWKYLTHSQRTYIAKYPMYSRVACFKGYNEKSFSFNTSTSPELFFRQFEIFKALLKEGLDMYAYVTFTAIPDNNLREDMEIFLDHMQMIHPFLPLRTVPLKIASFTPTQNRIKQNHLDALKFQIDVHEAWLEQLEKRFPSEDRKKAISEIPMYL